MPQALKDGTPRRPGRRPMNSRNKRRRRTGAEEGSKEEETEGRTAAQEGAGGYRGQAAGHSGGLRERAIGAERGRLPLSGDTGITVRVTVNDTSAALADAAVTSRGPRPRTP